MDLQSKKIIETVGANRLDGIHSLVEGITFTKDGAFFPCVLEDRRFGIAGFLPDTDRIGEILHVNGGIARLIGVSRDCIVYLDKHLGSGGDGPSIIFYDRKNREETKKVSIVEYLQQNR